MLPPRTLANDKFLSDVGLHLFLQSTLSVKEIEARLTKGEIGEDSSDVMEASLLYTGGHIRGLIRSSSLVDEGIELGVDGDSGYCYSTASSIAEIGECRPYSYEGFLSLSRSPCVCALVC